MMIPSKVSALHQLLDALRNEIDGAEITESWPRQQLERDTVVLSETINSQTDIDVVDQLGYQLDVWADDRDRAHELADQADAIICEVGFRRTMPGGIRHESYGFRITARYNRRVDKRFMRLIR